MKSHKLKVNAQHIQKSERAFISLNWKCAQPVRLGMRMIAVTSENLKLLRVRLHGLVSHWLGENDMVLGTLRQIFVHEKNV